MDKAELRREILARRAERSDSARAAASEAIAAHLLALPEVSTAKTVGCYVAIKGEPETAQLISSLLARKVRVLISVGRSEPNWADYENPDIELGADSIADADFLILPGLAVGYDGTRLGRGGGYYDKVLEHFTAPTCIALFSDEVLPNVPSEPHDQKVRMVATELGVARLQLI